MRSVPGLTALTTTWCGVAICVASITLAGDWPQFRGPAGNGISSERGVPQRWSPESNIRWKADLPGPGDSSPIVCRGRVFVTCASDDGKNRGLYCFDRSTGNLSWSRVVRYEKEDPTHQTNPYCGASPAADGERIVAWHGSAGVFCYDYEGRELWSRDLGTFRHIWGYGSSPIFHGDMVVLNCGPGARSFVIALDRATGKTLWQSDEPGGDSGEEKDAISGKPLWTGSWSTPVVAKVAGQDQLLVSLPKHVSAFDPRDGRVAWSCAGLGDLVYTSVLVGDGIGVAMGGYMGPAIGFRTGGTGDVTETNRLWLVDKGNPQRIGSGVVIGRHIFMANEPGIAQCLELDTGREVWKDRLPGGNIWGSIVAAEGRLYVTNQKGTTHLFRANPERFELIASNELGEASNSTPALSDGQIFVRTFEHLFCIEEK